MRDGRELRSFGWPIIIENRVSERKASSSQNKNLKTEGLTLFCIQSDWGSKIEYQNYDGVFTFVPIVLEFMRSSYSAQAVQRFSSVVFDPFSNLKYKRREKKMMFIVGYQFGFFLLYLLC